MTTPTAVAWDGVARGYIPAEALTIDPGLARHEAHSADVDPVTFEVIRYGLLNANVEHGQTLQRLCVSPITLLTRDFQPSALGQEGGVEGAGQRGDWRDAQPLQGLAVLDVGVQQAVPDHLERHRVDVGRARLVPGQARVDGEWFGRDVAARYSVPGHRGGRGHRAAPVTVVSSAGSRRRKCPWSAVRVAARGTAIVVWDNSTRAGPVISSPWLSRPPSCTAVASRVPASGQYTSAVRLAWSARPAGDAAPSSPAQRAAAGTRARARSVKISAAWNADAADSP